MTHAGRFFRGRKTASTAFAWALAAALNLSPATAPTAQPLILERTIPLPDVRGRIDHLDIDLDGGRLFVAALGNDTIEVVDLRTNRRMAPIEGLQEPQGVAYVRAGRRLCAANGKGGRVDIFSGDDLSPVAHVDALDDADNVRYDAEHARIYVGYGSGGLAVLDASTLQKMADVKLAGHPESFQLDSKGLRLYVNVPDAQQIAVVDPQKAAVVDNWKLNDVRGNFPMALDESNHRVFVATRRPPALLVYDAVNGQRIARLPGCSDADDVFFDGKTKRLYVICGEGVIDIVEQQDADHYEVNGRLKTAQGARTGLFVPSQRSLYVAVPARPSAPAEIRIYRAD